MFQFCGGNVVCLLWLALQIFVLILAVYTYSTLLNACCVRSSKVAIEFIKEDI